MELESGAKVKYHTGDEKWKNGVIHGVRKVDDVNNIPRVLSYIIDTGRHHRIDQHSHSLRDMSLNQHIQKHLKAGHTREEANTKAYESVKDMPDEVVTETVRQPEQVDVRPEWVKPR